MPVRANSGAAEWEMDLPSEATAAELDTERSAPLVTEAARESLLEEEGHARLGLVAAFQERQCYRDNPGDLELTARVVVIGSLFAVINGAVNMFFAFRYAGGLQQYWVIIVAYPVCKATELLPRGSALNPGPFSPKEHCLVMTMAIAGSLAGTLGLSGGMLALNLYFDTRLSAAQICDRPAPRTWVGPTLVCRSADPVSASRSVSRVGLRRRLLRPLLWRVPVGDASATRQVLYSPLARSPLAQLQTDRQTDNVVERHTASLA